MKKAFTLAEVLITLVIIGVIAALTIPALLQNTQQQEYKTAALKALSTISNATSMAYAKDGVTFDDLMDMTPDERTSELESMMQVSDRDVSLEFDASKAQGSSDYSLEGFSTTDGMLWGISTQGIWVDVNGSKGPNIAANSQDEPQDVIFMKPERYVADDMPQSEAWALYDFSCSCEWNRG
ncbi:MAG: type II secretion system protein [Candidatus Gastranaerophilales bacterium]|nr:type II secretion system protein [Candidatus Gastranaerophilales bacterium]